MTEEVVCLPQASASINQPSEIAGRDQKSYDSVFKMAGKYCASALSLFFEYDTPRIVHIRSKKVGLINRFIQLAVIGYIIGYVIIYKKGYQDFENVQAAVTTKLKGVIFSNYTHNPSIGMRTWDVADYVIPPQENNAFFVMTNVLVTNNQTQQGCAEDPSVKNITCTTDEDCESRRGTLLPGSSGPITGKCVNSTFPGKENITVCEIFGWCPVENEALAEPNPVLAGSKHFTVFIKNNIEFPKFGVRRRNLPENEDDDYFKRCHYNRSDPLNKVCPIFRLGDIVEEAGYRYENITMEGGVMQIVIDWTCNLDHSVEDCVPGYTFRRLDRGDFKISRGFNFRYANEFNDQDGKLFRNLYKAYGIRFLVTVQGKAGKFSIVPTLLNVGSGIGLLGVATIVCDIFVLYVLKARHFYREKKYLDVRGNDAFEILTERSIEDETSECTVKRRNYTSIASTNDS